MEIKVYLNGEVIAKRVEMHLREMEKREREARELARMLNMDPGELGFSQSARVRFSFREADDRTRAEDDGRLSAWRARVLGQRKKKWTNLPQCVRGTLCEGADGFWKIKTYKAGIKKPEVKVWSPNSGWSR